MSASRTPPSGDHCRSSVRPLILVVDDIAEIVEELVALLGLVEIGAVGVGTLGDAIAILESEPTIRIVICDLRLSRERGIDILAHVKRNPALSTRRLRYIFISGDPVQSQLLGDGFDGTVMSKPVQPRALIACLQEMLADGCSA